MKGLWNSKDCQEFFLRKLLKKFSDLVGADFVFQLDNASFHAS